VHDEFEDWLEINQWRYRFKNRVSFSRRNSTIKEATPTDALLSQGLPCYVLPRKA
jgi:hypothetical protein